jgi:hypothetical protein
VVPNQYIVMALTSDAPEATNKSFMSVDTLTRLLDPEQALDVSDLLQANKGTPLEQGALRKAFKRLGNKVTVVREFTIIPGIVVQMHNEVKQRVDALVARQAGLLSCEADQIVQV